MTEETIHNEWHRTPENKAIIERLVKYVFNADSVLIAHHICYTKDGETYELASAETFLFDHYILERLFGNGWEQKAIELVLTPPHERLKLLGDYVTN
jgi:hypothetical protein